MLGRLRGARKSVSMKCGREVAGVSDIVIRRRSKSSPTFWGLVRVPPSQTRTDSLAEFWCVNGSDHLSLSLSFLDAGLAQIRRFRVCA